MTSTHEPTPEFERYLEWQVTTALRRQDRFARPSAFPAVVPMAGFGTFLQAVAVVVVSISLGAGVVMASGRKQQNQERQLLTVQQQGALQLAEAQVEIAQKSLDQTKQRADVGVAQRDDVTAAERTLRAAVLGLQRAKLSLEEVQASGRPAQDDVTAPVVNARDFVLERMQLDQQTLVTAAAEAENSMQSIQKLVDVGVTPQLALLEAQAELTRRMADVNAIKEEIALRHRFTAGNVSAEAATRQRLMIAAQNELLSAQALLEVATKRDAQLEKQRQIGVVGDLDVLKAKVDLLTRQQEIEKLRERIAILQKGGPLPDGRR